MTKQHRHWLAEEYRLQNVIGRKVSGFHPLAYRRGEIAEVVGWSICEENKRPQYCIKYEDGECIMILASNFMLAGGYEFVD